MRPAVRKLSLAAHVAFSLGWLGADAAFLLLAIVGLTAQDLLAARSAYVSMEPIGLYVIVPFSLASLLTGLVLALGTPWGLFRHYWVAAKFLLTAGATLVLLLHTGAMREAALRASDLSVETLTGLRAHLAASGAGGHLGDVQAQLVVTASAGLLVLLTIAVLGVFKPKGVTPWGRHARLRGTRPR